MSTFEVISPLPGTFYRKSAPDVPNYVEEGQTVTAQTVIGLIEVMKQYSEVYAEQAGVIESFAVKDGDPVEPGQVIAVIK